MVKIMKKQISQNRRKQRGSALTELALIFVVVLSMLIGALDFGQFLYIHQSLTERAREGVRYGVTTSPVDTTGVQNMVLYGQATQPTGAAGTFGLTSAMVIVSTPDAGTDDYRVSVKVTNYPYTIFSPWIAGSYTGPDILAELPLGANFQ
jgi:Flp pilus assembly protein TadG